jgi:hypothetical protein
MSRNGSLLNAHLQRTKNLQQKAKLSTNARNRARTRTEYDINLCAPLHSIREADLRGRGKLFDWRFSARHLPGLDEPNLDVLKLRKGDSHGLSFQLSWNRGVIEVVVVVAINLPVKSSCVGKAHARDDGSASCEILDCYSNDDKPNASIG